MKITNYEFVQIQPHHKIVDEYAEKRIARYGVAGAVPAEFLPVYQGLRRNDSSRVYVEYRRTIFLVKKVRIFKAQWNRVEGLPISLNGDQGLENKVLQEILKSPLLHKIRCCAAEAIQLQEMGIKSEEEDAISNFYIHLKARAQRISKGSWRGKSILNYAREHGKLIWRPAEPSDYPEIEHFYESWSRKKEADGQDVMYKKLYEGILDGVLKRREGLLSYILTFEGRLIGFVAYALSGKTAHLLANQVIGKTEEIVDEQIRKVAQYAGHLCHYFTVHSLLELGLEHAFLGYVEKSDSLNVYKTATSDGHTKLFIAKLRDPEEKKEEEREGFF